MDDLLEEPWGLLVTKEGGEDERVPVLGKEFIIGRAKDCNLCITNSKLVSNHHCVLMRDDGGKVLLKDTSSNGTLVNGKLIKKNEVNNGDVIHLVSKKNHHEENIAEVGEIKSETTKDDPKNIFTANEGAKSGVITATDDSSSKEKEGSKEKVPRSSLSRENSMEESLLCGICQEILHDCISLQPCMHCYCSGCYSGWMDRSNECPQCRVRVKRISKNHIVNNLAISFLKSNPDKKRSDEDLAELDSKNKITKEILYPKRRHGYDPDESIDDDEYDDDEYGTASSSDEESRGGPAVGFMLSSAPYPGVFTSPLSGFIVPPVATCRQCPAYTGLLSPLCRGTTVSYTCPTPASHVMCQCCLQFMPIRPPPSDTPPQKCALCDKFYCNQYWQSGCRGMACNCLRLFKDVTADIVPTINDNLFETNILRSYLRDNSISVSDMVKELIIKFENKEYHPPTTSGLTSFTSSSAVCKDCSSKILSELTYIYRSKISMDDLPE